MAFKSAERSDSKFIMSMIDGSMYPASVDIFRWLVQGGTHFCHIEGSYIIISMKVKGDSDNACFFGL